MNSHKRSVFEASIATAKKVQVLIIPGGAIEMPADVFSDYSDGNVVKAKGFAILEYGLDMPIPIPDMEIEHDGIRATLSFPYGLHATFVPWSNVGLIRIIESGFTAVWNAPESAMAGGGGGGGIEIPKKDAPARSHLRLV